MGELKIKIKQGQSEIELQGDGELVLKVFQEIRMEGLGEVSSIDLEPIGIPDQKTDDIKSKTEDEVVVESQNNAPTSVDLPTMHSLALSLEIKKEMYWVLLYCFYITEGGKETFTNQDIRDMYDVSNRSSKSRFSNLSYNVKNLVKSNYIEAINSSEYRISKLGYDTSLDIIKNKGVVSEKTKAKKKSKRTKKIHTYDLVELNLKDDQKDDLRHFWETHNHINAQHKVTLLGYWLHSNSIINQFGENEIFTLLKILQESTNFDIGAALRNAKTFKNFLKNGDQQGYYQITHIVDDFVTDVSEN